MPPIVRSTFLAYLRRPLRALVPAALLAVATSGCNPTYAPPVRAAHYGAPGRVRQGDVEIGGTVSGVTYPWAGSVHVAYGVRDWVSVEAGGTVIGGVSVTGWAGSRFTLPRRPSGVSPLLDLELGVGGGVGGSLCPPKGSESSICDFDGRAWYSRPTFGGYEGVGVGFGVAWFSLYGRGRVEESTATSVPVTYWPSGFLGFGFELTPRLSLDLGGGYLGYYNEREHVDGWFYQFGLSGRFGTAK